MQTTISLSALLGLIVCYVNMELARLRDDRTTLFLSLWGFLYPIGRLSQAFLFLPRIIRWHLADIGGVPFFTLVGVLYFFHLLNIQRNPLTIRTYALLVLLVCFINELIEGAFGSWDTGDVISYFIGFGITWIVADTTNRRRVLP